MNLAAPEKCLVLGLALLLTPTASAEGLTGTVLWQSSSTQLEQSGPTPARLTYRAADGQKFLLVAVELNIVPSDAGPIRRIPAAQIRLSAADEHYPMLGTFDENGRLQWFAPGISVFPGGGTRLRAIFEPPAEALDLKLEIGSDLRLGLTEPTTAVTPSERLSITVVEGRVEGEAPTVEPSRDGVPATTLDPWPGARFVAIAVDIQGKGGAGVQPLVLTSDDFFVQTAGRVYRCVGVIRGDPARLAPSPASILVPGSDSPADAARRVRLLFSLDSRESKLWLRLGSIAVPFEVSAESSPR